MQVLAQGGPWVLVVMAATGIVSLVCPLLFVLQVVRLRVPALFYVPLAFLPAVLGAVGSWLGIDQMTAALMSSGSITNRPALASYALADAVLPAAVGAAGTVVLLLCFAVALGLGMVARPGRTARLTAENALVAGLLTGLGALGGWLVGGVLVGLVTFSVGLTLVIAALRFPTEDPRDLRRVASGRLTVAALGVSALAMFGVVQGFRRVFDYHLAVRQPMQLAARLQSSAMEGWVTEALGIGGLCLLFALATPFVVGPGMRSLDARGGVVAVLTAGLLFAMPLAEVAVAWKVSTVWHFTRSPAETRLEAQAALGVEVPGGVEVSRVRPLTATSALTFASSGPLFDGNPVTALQLRDELEALTNAGSSEILLEAPADTPLSEITPLAAVLGADDRVAVCVVVRTPVGLGCLQLDVMHRPLPPPADVDEAAEAPEGEVPAPVVAAPSKTTLVAEPDLSVLETTDGWFWRYTDPPDPDTMSGSASSVADLSTALGDVLVAHPDAVRASLWMRPDLTFGDLVLTASRLQKPATDFGYELWPQLVWRTDPPGFLQPVDGPLEGYAGVAMRAVRDNEVALARCLQRERMSNPGVSGRIESQLSIGPDGRVIRATVARSSVPNPALEQCVTSALRMMEFPAPESGQIEVVRLPWSFGP